MQMQCKNANLLWTYSTTKGSSEGVRPFGPAGKGGGAAGGPQEELRHAHRRADRSQAGRPVDQQGGKEAFLFSISIYIHGREPKTAIIRIGFVNVTVRMRERGVQHASGSRTIFTTGSQHIIYGPYMPSWLQPWINEPCIPQPASPW